MTLSVFRFFMPHLARVRVDFPDGLTDAKALDIGLPGRLL